MSHTKNKSGPPRFQVGNKVRVKYGVIDPDFPDIPLRRLFTNAEPLPKFSFSLYSFIDSCRRFSRESA
jgi:hypothetical protein